jgi:hypothetical protein
MRKRDDALRAELEEKKVLVQQLKQKKAETEKHISNLQNSISSQRAEIASAIRYMDELARPNLVRLQELRSLGNQAPPAELKRIQSQLDLYTHTREAMVRFEKSMGTTTSLVEQTVAMRLAEAEIVVASAKMVMVDFAATRQDIQNLLNGAKMSIEDRKRLAPAVDRLKKMPILQQRLQAAFHFFSETEQAIRLEDQQVQQLRALQGREALKFASSLKIGQLTGKVNQIRSLRPSFQAEPLILALFPEWVEVQIPRAKSGGQESSGSKPFTGMLKELFGLK